MVSLQQSSIFSQENMKLSPAAESSPLSKKRKWLDDEVANQGINSLQESKLWKRPEKSDKAFDLELHLDSPLPLEWQRCLDIKSGQIHYYNTRTKKRTSTDPRIAPEAPRPSLDLELNLNLTSEPARGHTVDGDRCNSPMRRSLSWVCLDVGNHKGEGEGAVEEEMVAAVCTRCHMLVMMCKAAPSCPNCKFVNKQEEEVEGSSELEKTEFRVLCCKD